jgi:hypothetical protein
MTVNYHCTMVNYQDYLSLTPRINVTKPFTMEIYCHSVVFTMVILFYNNAMECE